MVFSASSIAEENQRPRLVLQITVDQLRGDLLERDKVHFGESGFRYLLDNGVKFVDAHHRHANTETIVGHTTLATGTDPAVHGMVANLWFDRKTGQPYYNVQDGKYPLLSKGGIDQSTEIDPTQRAATTDGRSPRTILSSTIADEIAIGVDEKTDYLAVSFSSTDYVGHIFGPSSLESEDNLRRLDQTLAKFLGFIDDTVGLDRTLVILSADHGSPEVPGYLKSIGVEAGNFNFDDVDKHPAIEALKAKFGVAEELVASFPSPTSISMMRL